MKDETSAKALAKIALKKGIPYIIGASHPLLGPALDYGVPILQSHHQMRTAHLAPQLTNYRSVIKYKPQTRKPVSKVTAPKNLPNINHPAREFLGKKNISPNYTMPYKKSYRKRTRRTRRKSYKKRILPALTWPRTKIVRFKMNLSPTTAFTGTSGAIIKYDVTANSLDSPFNNIGSSTALPLGLDQWAGMYSKYIVLGSKLTFKASLITADTAGVIGIHLDDASNSSLAITDHDHYRELPKTRYRYITDQKDFVTVSMNYSGKKFWHVRSLTSDSEQEGDFSTTPTAPSDVAYFHIFAQDLNKTETIQIQPTLHMEFIVLLTNPIRPARSVDA